MYESIRRIENANRQRPMVYEQLWSDYTHKEWFLCELPEKARDNAIEKIQRAYVAVPDDRLKRFNAMVGTLNRWPKEQLPYRVRQVFNFATQDTKTPVWSHVWPRSIVAKKLKKHLSEDAVKNIDLAYEMAEEDDLEELNRNMFEIEWYLDESTKEKAEEWAEFMPELVKGMQDVRWERQKKYGRVKLGVYM